MASLWFSFSRVIMNKLLTSVCAIAIGAAIGLSVDLKKASAMPPLSIGLMQPATTQAAATYSRATLISTYMGTVQASGTSKSVTLAAPTGAELLVVAVMKNYTTSPTLTAEPAPTLNGVAMTVVAESERSQMGWARVAGGYNYTVGWASSTQMKGSAIHCWWFKGVSKICPVIGGRRDPTGSSYSAAETCFSGQIASITVDNEIRFYAPTSPRPTICAVTSVESKGTEGTWQTLNMPNMAKLYTANTLTAAVGWNGAITSDTGTGTVGFKLANTGAAQFQEMSMCEVVGLSEGYPELYVGPTFYNPSTTGTSKTFSGVDFGPAPTGKRLVVVTGQSINQQTVLTGLTIGGVNAQIRLMSDKSGIWDDKGCWLGFAQVPTGTSGSIVCTFGGNGGETVIQVYSIYSTDTITESFTQSRDASGDFDTQTGTWQFMVVSVVSEGVGTTYLNNDILGCLFHRCSVTAGTMSGYSFPMSGVVATNINTGPFTVSLKERGGGPIAGVMSVFA